jgi:DNA-nicking Smr family endonuclease
MDFDDILRRWDRLQKEESSGKKKGQNPGPGKKANAPSWGEAPSGNDVLNASKPSAAEAPNADGARLAMERWIASHGVSDKDAEARETGDEDRAGRIREAERLRRLKPQASLDLHGRTAVEAEALLTEFLASSARSGLDKVLVIHGKGIHSSSEPIMSDLVRRILERSDLAGSFGPADKESGGRGAAWVLIRKKVYFSR